MKTSLILLLVLIVTLATALRFKQPSKRCMKRCGMKKLNKEQCTTYCHGKDVLRQCLIGGMNHCRSLVVKKLAKKVCFVQSRKKCYMAFRDNLQQNNVVVSAKKCSGDYDCEGGNFCKKSGKKFGKCSKKYIGFCRGMSECSSKSFCDKELEESYGTCKLKENEKKKMQKQKKISENSDLLVPLNVEVLSEVPAERMQEAIREGLMDQEANEDETTCGNEHSHIKHHHHHHHDAQEDILEEAANTLNKGTIPPCGTTICDDPSVRDTYTKSLGVKHKIFWAYFQCHSDWNSVAKKNIAEATTFLNTKFAPLGVSFVSEVSTFACQGANAITQSSMVGWLEKAFGSKSAIQAKGGFTILVGKPAQSSLNGWMYYPWSGSYSGLGFMNTRVTKAGVTTLAHELGHAFGLPHTFAGTSSSCGNCYEKSVSSNDKGDFCADTPNIPRNWQCSTPLKQGESCGSKTQWENPFKNIMSYGTCRSDFSPQQIRRARCYHQTKMTWLKNVGGGNNNGGGGTTPKPTTKKPTTQKPSSGTPVCRYGGKNYSGTNYLNYKGTMYRCGGTKSSPKWIKVTTATTTPKPTTKKPTTQKPTTQKPSSSIPVCRYGGKNYSGTNYLNYKGTMYRCGGTKSSPKWIKVTTATTTRPPTTQKPTTKKPSSNTPVCRYGGKNYSGKNYLNYKGTMYRCGGTKSSPRWIKVTGGTTTTTKPPATTRPATTTKPSGGAGVQTLSAAEKKWMVDRMNSFRRGSSVSPRPSPQLPTVSWDNALEERAKAWGGKCQWGHSNNRPYPIGENLSAAASNSGFQTAMQQMKQGQTNWENEYKQYKYSSNSCSGVCGHYTVMVRRPLTKVGCAVIKCSNLSNSSLNKYKYKTMMVCNYDNTNIRGKKPY